MVISTFERAKASAVDKAETQARKLREAGKLAEAELQRVGKEVLHDTYQNYRRLAGAIFALLFALSVVSFVVLASAIVGGFNLVLGRLVFDPRLTQEDKSSQTKITFRLNPEDGDAEALNFESVDDLKLRDEKRNVETWFVSFYATRMGAGTHMRLSVPQPSALFFQRLLTGRLLMTRVDVSVVTKQESGEPHNPRISAPGDLKVVCINVKRGQEVVFHVGEMLAFSDGISLQSIYTAHVAAHLLGLGSFYSVAAGEGYLVLLSEGARVRKVNKWLSLPPDSLLAWDRRTEFSLAQEVTLAGVWFNDPSVISNSGFGAGIVDEGRAGSPGLFNRFLRLVRYLFMPF